MRSRKASGHRKRPLDANRQHPAIASDSWMRTKWAPQTHTRHTQNLPCSRGSLRDLGAHRIDGLLVVRAVEDGRACDEHVGAGRLDLTDVLDAHATVNLKRNVVAGLVDHLARLLELVERGGDESLAAEAGVDGHEENDINLV